MKIIIFNKSGKLLLWEICEFSVSSGFVRKDFVVFPDSKSQFAFWNYKQNKYRNGDGSQD